MDEKDKMQIPAHCSKGGEIAEGFGKKEFALASIFALVGLLIGSILFFLKTKEVLSIVLGLSIGACAGYVFCKKDRYTRSSLLEDLMNMMNFYKSQKYYEFRRIKNEKEKVK